MGAVKSFISKSGIDVFSNKLSFIETGTGRGESVEYAMTRMSHENITTIEYDERTYQYCLNKFSNTKINLIRSSSIDYLNSLTSANKNLFWLDAHFPGCFMGDSFHKEPDLSKRLPLFIELKRLSNIPGMETCDILIDDLRIYVDGYFENGSWSDEDKKQYGCDVGIDPIYELFKDTHDITTYGYDEGYILLSSKIKD